jgi:hypothetical protein
MGREFIPNVAPDGPLPKLREQIWVGLAQKSTEGV